MLEEQPDVCVGLSLGLGDAGAHHVRRFILDRLVELVAENAEPAEIALVAAETLVLLLLLDPLEIDVRARIVGGRMRRGPYVTASMNVGPLPARARSTASRVAS